jgi:NADPH2:quinone reductase
VGCHSTAGGREFAGGRGVDVIIEMLANVNLERDFEALNRYGRIVIVGNRGSLQFTPRQAMTKDATIYGMSLFNSFPKDLDEIHAAIYDGLAAGYLSPVIRTSIPLSEAPRSHHEVIENKSLGKIVLVP